MKAAWRIEQLAKLVGAALAAAEYDGQSSGRVRDVPDLRTIRYYTTIGLLDRPLEMRGRVAYYGRKHLLQLVAVKRLQSRGLTLVEVQQMLAGASDRKLAAWADLRPRFLEDLEVASGAEQTAAPARRGRDRFWAQPCEPADQASATESPDELRPSVVIRMGRGISLLLEGVGPDQVDNALIQSLAPGAMMLQEALASRFPRSGPSVGTTHCDQPLENEKETPL